MTDATTKETTIPQSIVDALDKAANAMPALVKLETNEYASYRYVSIDRYYEVVREIALKAGLWWALRETEFAETKFNQEGKPTMVTFYYSVDLFALKDGAYVKAYDGITVPHPWQGAQTSGAARSYADKTFMRTLFKVVTGEPDSDAFSQSVDDKPDAELAGMLGDEPATPDTPAADDLDLDSLKDDKTDATEAAAAAVAAVTATTTTDPVDQILEAGKQEAQRTDPELAEDMKLVMVGRAADGGYPIFKDADALAEIEKQDRAIITVTEVFKSFVTLCKDGDSLRNFWKENSSAIDYVKETSSEHYDIIKEVFISRSNTLKGEASG